MKKDRLICTTEKANKVGGGETEFIFTGQITGMQMLNTIKNKSESGSVRAKCQICKERRGFGVLTRHTRSSLNLVPN